MDQAALDQMNNTLSAIQSTLTSVSNNIASIIGKIPYIGDAVDGVGKSADDTADAMREMTQSTEQATRAGSNHARVTTQQANSSNSLINKIKDYGNALKNQANDLINTNDGQKLMLQGMGLLAVATGIASDNLSDFNKETGVGSISAGQTAETVANLNDELRKLPGGSVIANTLGPLISIAGNIEKTTSQVKKFENSILSTLGSFGGFKDINRVDFVKNLDTSLIQIVRQTSAVAGSTNLASKEIANYQNYLMKLPGAYNTVIDLTDIGSKKMSLLEGATRLARGTTGDFTDSLDAITNQFKQFGQTNEKSLDFMARTYALSQKLGVGFKDMSEPINDAVKQFAMFGNNMQSSINLVGALTKSLKDTGLGIEPTTRIVQNITKAMYGLSESQKAVISAQTGGPGGLRGAFQIDQMISEGKMDEVYQKMEQTLRQQFGGRIVNKEEAAASDDAAAQMQQQIQFLTSGPFGQVVGDRAQAMKLLEAMNSGGGIDTAAMGREVDSGMSDALTADKAIQDRQYSAQSSIANHTQRILQEFQILNAMTIREKGKDFNLDDIVRNYIKKSSIMSGEVMSGAQITPVDSLIQDIGSLKSTVLNDQDGILKLIGDGISDSLAQSSISQSVPIPNQPEIIRTQNPTIPTTDQSGTLQFEPLEVHVTITDSAGAIIDRQNSRARVSVATGIQQ